MAIKRNVSVEVVRSKVLARFWVLAKNEIGEDYAFEIAERLFPKNVSSITHRGLSMCSVEELKEIVHELDLFSKGEKKDVGQSRQVGPVRPVGQKKSEIKKKPTGKPVVIPELGKPATGKQMTEINRLAGELRISDAYLIGIYQKVMGGKTGTVTVGIAQSVIEALKQISRRQK